ncbi:hypothetical protein RAB80_016941 [Fusarium oxysporum f. sp. vasinfectum]|nr:hypothetical protein RAB80_017899 [Fusarium oxysporum f. sp. vasinfectum]KAK2667750.1 hypothetical protein RAB80_016941 [Fusarium oxysporum f. sp. vasinfectum]KAK2922886.1 hypothetical protein FoTM2_017126 [Fusarium oxysporum f. sp. vasinfectum]
MGQSHCLTIELSLSNTTTARDEEARYQDTTHEQDSMKAYPTQKLLDTRAHLNTQALFYHSDPQRAFVTPRFVSSSRLDIICSRDQLRGQNKPRNIEKDVKVFPWRILESALKKIIGKYSVNPSTPVPPPMMS